MTDHRVFTTSRRVRVGDCDGQGNVRIDALARYLQDIGYDDTEDIGVGDGGYWVARSISMSFESTPLVPQRNEFVHLSTYCSGIGRAFAQRNVEITTQAGAHINTSTIWVSLSEEGKPTEVPQWLMSAYPHTKKVSSARTLGLTDSSDPDVISVDWVLRASDYDINDHVNNAVAFDALYEVAHTVSAQPPAKVLVEYHQPIQSQDRAQLLYKTNDNGFDAWLASSNRIAAAMQWMYLR